jgi:hypothetical protein
MPQHRQSALLLHGLAEADRRWILARLPNEDQQILDAHLSELKSLGIPADPVLLDTAMVAARAPRRGVVADPLQRASASQMQALLAEEPVWLVRHVLALEAWPWKQDFLAAQNANRRERLLAAGQSPAAAGSKVAERLRAQLTQRLADADFACAAGQPHRSASPGLLNAAQQMVRRWF